MQPTNGAAVEEEDEDIRSVCHLTANRKACSSFSNSAWDVVSNARSKRSRGKHRANVLLHNERNARRATMRRDRIVSLFLGSDGSELAGTELTLKIFESEQAGEDLCCVDRRYGEHRKQLTSRKTHTLLKRGCYTAGALQQSAQKRFPRSCGAFSKIFIPEAHTYDRYLPGILFQRS